MSLNGPFTMYKIKPLYDFSPAINLPTCMYKMNNLYNSSQPLFDNSSPSATNLNEDGLNLLEIEKHQLNILQKLEDLKCKVLNMKEELGIKTQIGTSVIHSDDVGQFQDIVVKANPENPPLSLWVFYKLLSQSFPVRLVTFVHSSLVNLPEQIKQIQNISSSEYPKISLTVIWKDEKSDAEMVVNPINQGVIEGEVNIARYIARLIHFNYDSNPILSTLIDNWLETAHSCIIHGNNKERQAALKSLNAHLGKNSFLVFDNVSLADIVVWSALVQTKLHTSLPTNVSKWYKMLLENDIFSYCKSLPFL